MEATIGSRLVALKERAGLSLAELARLAGYQGPSSIQKLFKADYNPKVLQATVAQRLSKALVGRGDPAIDESDIAALTGKGEVLDLLLADLQHYNFLASANIGMHRTRRVEKDVYTDDGRVVPLFVREEMVGGIPFYPCPDFLRPRGIVGLYISVANMWPRFEEGEPVFYEHSRPAARGDDVLVTLRGEEYPDGAMIIGRLAALQEAEVCIDQLSPQGQMVLDRKDVASVRRIMHATDFLKPVAYALAD